jgi:hypothetical protein
LSINVAKFTAEEKDLKNQINPEQQNHHITNHTVGLKTFANANDAIADKILE